MPATQQMTVIASAKASEAIAPEMSDVGSSQRQTARPIAAPKATIARNGTTASRTNAERNRPRMRTRTPPPSRAISGESPAQSMCGPCMAAITAVLRSAGRSLAHP